MLVPPFATEEADSESGSVRRLSSKTPSLQAEALIESEEQCAPPPPSPAQPVPAPRGEGQGDGSCSPMPTSVPSLVSSSDDFFVKPSETSENL